MNLNINKNEILRYLGYSGQTLDDKTINLMDECIEKLNKAIKPRYIYKIFKTEEKEDGISLKETDLVLKGKDIRNHLSSCGDCAVLAATLGINADNLIRISQSISMSEAVVLDACAVEFIEKVCDNVCDEIERKVKEYDSELKITSRFSAGYGDLGIEIQPDILRIVDANRKIGLTVTESNIMIPRKSVTAIVGIYKGDKKSKALKGCGSCNLKDTCTYRKRGVLCNDNR